MDYEQDIATLNWLIETRNRWANAYRDVLAPQLQPLRDTILVQANLANGERVLDLGCATGELSRAAALAVGSSGCVTGIDVSPAMLELARGQRSGFAQLGFAEDGGELKFAEGRGEWLDYDDASIDVVISALSLEQTSDRNQAAQEIARVLKPGGRFVAAVWRDADNTVVALQKHVWRETGLPFPELIGPGACADAEIFLAQLQAAGIAARKTSLALTLRFDDLDAVWATLVAHLLHGVDSTQSGRIRQSVSTSNCLAASLWIVGGSKA